MNIITHTVWLLIVDTNNYSGNFSRPLVAFCTGNYGECGVGEAEAEDYIDYCREKFGKPVFMELAHLPDDNGTRRPASIWPTPGRLNDGHGNHYDAEEGKKGWAAYESVAAYFYKRPTDQEIEIFKERVKEFEQYYSDWRPNSPKFKVTNIRLIEYIVEPIEKEYAI